jgi:hypothetical protein
MFTLAVCTDRTLNQDPIQKAQGRPQALAGPLQGDLDAHSLNADPEENRGTTPNEQGGEVRGHAQQKRAPEGTLFAGQKAA